MELLSKGRLIISVELLSKGGLDRLCGTLKGGWDRLCGTLKGGWGRFCGTLV